MNNFEKAEAVVLQTPVKVKINCPYCDCENEYDYVEFVCRHGEPCDWEYEKVVCEECGGIIEIDGQDWQ